MTIHTIVGVGVVFIAVGCNREAVMNDTPERYLVDVKPSRQVPIGNLTGIGTPVACSSTGAIAVGTRDGLRVGSVLGGPFRQFGVEDWRSACLAFDPTGMKVLACSAKVAAVWDVDTGHELARHEFSNVIVKVVMRPDGESAYLLRQYGGDILLWNYAKNEIKTVIRPADCPTLPNRDRRYIGGDGLAVIDDHLIFISVEPGLLIYDTRTKADRFVRVGEKWYGISGLTPSNDGKQLAFKRGGTVYVYDVATWQEKFHFIFPAVLDEGSPLTTSIHYTHDGNSIVTTGGGMSNAPGFVGVFDASTGNSVCAFQASGKDFQSLAVTPDDQFIVTAGVEGVRFWDLQALLKRYKKP